MKLLYYEQHFLNIRRRDRIFINKTFECSQEIITLGIRIARVLLRGGPGCDMSAYSGRYTVHCRNNNCDSIQFSGRDEKFCMTEPKVCSME